MLLLTENTFYMMKWTKISLTVIFCIGSMSVFAQDDTNLKSDVEAAIEEWKGYAEVLETYQGLSQYCRDVKFRENVILTLNNIHHYDTLVLSKTIDKSTEKDISEFEKKYSTSNFKEHLKKECKERRLVEREKKKNPGGFATESYEAQKLIVQTEVQRYIGHVNKVANHIENDIKKSDL